MSYSGISHQSSCPHSPQQNGVTERKNRHLLEVILTLLFEMNIPKHFWGDAVLTACFLINWMLFSTLNGKVLHSILFPRSPLYSLPLRIFGCVCFVHQLTPSGDKLDPRALKCIFLGYSRTKKDYRCYSLSLRRSFVCADVTFFESTPYFSAPSSQDDLHVTLPLLSVPNPTLSSSTPDPIPPSHSSASLQVYSRRQKVASAIAPIDSVSSDSSLAGSSMSDLDMPVAIRKGKRTCTNHPISNFVSYAHLSPSYSFFVTSLFSVSIPKSVSEALTHLGWAKTMEEEMFALHQNDTWDLVSLPLDKTVVGCKWVYTIKVHLNGTIDLLKARLIAKGYSQVLQ